MAETTLGVETKLGSETTLGAETTFLSETWGLYQRELTQYLRLLAVDFSLSGKVLRHTDETNILQCSVFNVSPHKNTEDKCQGTQE